jgi:DNA ligase-1
MSLFLPFCHVAERVGATTLRLEKAKILGEYFASLVDEDLKRAALYFGGYLFPLREGRTVNIGGAALFAAIYTVTKCDETWLRERLVACGDAGDLAQEAWIQAERNIESALELAEIEVEIARLAQTAGAKAKLARVIEILERCSALEAKYFVKMLSGDLRIGLKEGAVEDALARLSKQPVALVQRANMLVGDLGEVALLARRERLEDATFQLFHPLKFMLATPAADLEDVARQMPESFVVEDKFDGIRAQVHLAWHQSHDELLHGELAGNVRVALFSRTLDEITSAFPDLHLPLGALLPPDSPGLVLDGELVPLARRQNRAVSIVAAAIGPQSSDSGNFASGSRCVRRLRFAVRGRKRIGIAVRRASREIGKLTFQLARNVGGFQTIREHLFRRRRIRRGARQRQRRFDDQRPARALQTGASRARMAQNQTHQRTLGCCGDQRGIGSGRRSKFYSDFTFAVRASEDDATLLNVGKAYSGLTDKEIQELSDWFVAHTIQTFAHGRVRTVEPQIVLEITFDRVQASSRHKSGFALRFPRILRRRDDKSVDEIDTLETVRKLADAEENTPA